MFNKSSKLRGLSSVAVLLFLGVSVFDPVSAIQVDSQVLTNSENHLENHLTL